MTTGVATIEQTLHGYDAGHRLLQSSVDLPPDARDVLAALSDLSGTRLSAGFEAYLSGYPLEGTEYYVFARTWLAQEMPRPGCVWTHSLLIRVSDLAFLSSLPRLCALHVRPSQREPKEYSRTLSIPLSSPFSESDVPRLSDAELRLARALVVALYGSDSDQPIVVAASDAGAFEHLVVRLWDQQWPRLRRTFKFCTGALSKRILNGHEFDLQIMPVPAARLAAHNKATVIAAGSADVGGSSVEHASETESQSTTPLSESQQRWLDAIVADVALGEPDSALRQWTVVLGAEGTGPRSLASESLRLATLLAERPQRVSEVVRVLAEMYPDAVQGVRVKKAILGPSSDRSRDRRSLSEGDVLTALATTPHAEAFTVLADGIRARAYQYWQSDQHGAAQMLYALSHKSINALGGEVLRGLAEAIPAPEFASFARSRPGLIALAVQTRPALLEEAEIWATPQLAREALQALALVPFSVRPSPKLVLPVIARCRLPDSVALSALYSPRELTAALLAFVRGGESDSEVAKALLGDTSMRCALTAGLPEIFVQLVDDLRSLTALADASELDTLKKIPVLEWQLVTDRHGRNIGSALASVVLAVSMAATEREAGALAAGVFPVVYEAVRTGRLAERDWERVVQGLPSVPSWLEWDRCERLRRWLVEAFVAKKRWKLQDFVSAIPDDTALEGLLNYGQSHSRSRDFLRRLADAVDDGKVIVGRRQRDAILEVARPRRWKLF